MFVTRTLVFAGLLLTLLAGMASAEPRRYVIDPAPRQIVIHVGKSGVLGFAGHDHEVVGAVTQGTAVIDQQRLEASSVELAFDAASLRVTGRGEPAGDVPKVQEAMVGPECLDAARFPVIRFRSQAIAVARGGQGAYDLAIRGELTLHGVSRPVQVLVHVVLQNGSVTATGSTKIRQTEFGIKPISVGGVVKVKDEIAIEWHLAGRLAR
jgi:polyisoprenoid-binding protein YceI